MEYYYYYHFLCKDESLTPQFAGLETSKELNEKELK